MEEKKVSPRFDEHQCTCGKTVPAGRTTWYCQECHAAKGRENYQKHKERLAAEKREHRRLYPEKRKEIDKRALFKKMGVTQEWYESMAAYQGNKCAICGEDEGCDGYRLRIDHDHDCCDPRVSCDSCRRGLLCGSCNLLLGSALDNPAILKTGAAYLRKYAEVDEVKDSI